MIQTDAANTKDFHLRGGLILSQFTATSASVRENRTRNGSLSHSMS